MGEKGAVEGKAGIYYGRAPGVRAKSRTPSTQTRSCLAVILAGSFIFLLFLFPFFEMKIFIKYYRNISSKEAHPRQILVAFLFAQVLESLPQ